MNGAALRVRKPLPGRLLKRVLLFSAVLIVLLAGARAWWEYRATLAAVHEEFAVIESTKAKSVAASLWDFDREQLALHAEGIRHFQFITYACVRDATGVVAQSGVHRDKGVLVREFPLSVVYNGQLQELGVLQVQADVETLRRSAWRTAWLALAINAALVLLVAGLMVWLANNMISRHLAAFAAHIGSFSLGGDYGPLVLDKKPVGDELDVLASALNTMQTGLVTSYGQVLEAQSQARGLARFPQENPSPVLRAGAGGLLLTANPASAGLLAHLGVQVGQRLPEEYAAIVSRALLSGEVQRFESDFGGRTFTFAASPISAEGFVNVYGMDITGRKLAEEEVRRNVLRLQCVVRVLQYAGESVQEFLDHALSEALTLTESRFGYLYHYNEERREFVLNTWSGEVMAECAVPGEPKVYQLDKTGIWGEAVRQRKPIILNDFGAANPFKRGYPEGHVDLVNFMTVPVFLGERIVAVAGVGNKGGDYQDADVQQLSLLMDACWQVVGRLDAEGGVRRSLHEKEILLKEIHHRVKNNLQIISSLLFLQAEYVVDPQDRAMFEESQKRISAMALVHEELYGSRDLSSVDMGDYVPRLVERVVASSDVSVRMEFEVEDLRLPVTQSIPCGLVLNELVMNAVKHAFRDGREGRLRVSLLRRGSRVELAVEDNGPGLPLNFDLNSPATLGLTLITSLARQLGGEVTTQGLEAGARFVLVFPAEGQ